MAGNILTPKTLWDGFRVDSSFESEFISEREEDGVTVKKFYIPGRKTAKGRVKISVLSAYKKIKKSMPAVLLFQSPKTISNQNLAIALSKQGYYVLSVDYVGKIFGGDKCTFYPEDVEYANFDFFRANDTEHVDDVQSSCWFEWSAVGMYALAYLKSQAFVSAVGLLGVADGAVPVWHMSAICEGINSSVCVMNAGWKAYKGLFRFANEIIPQFSNEQLSYIAGVEPQSYAPNVKCPTLILVSTNNDLYDSDRAYDTLLRINEDVYSALDYSVNYRERVDYSAFKNILVFFDKYLFKEETYLPFAPEVKITEKEGVIVAVLKVDDKELKKLNVYVAEDTIDPAKRSWTKIAEQNKKDDGEYIFEYVPYKDSEQVFFFARAVYESGFSLSSNIVAKKIEKGQVKCKDFKDKVLFSSRRPLTGSVFTENDRENYMGIINTKPVRVEEKEGPMDIDGIYAEDGLMTFKINAKKDKPEDDAILMLDVYSKENAVLVVQAIINNNGSKTVYSAKMPILGGDIWNNVQISIQKFKTEEGFILKSFNDVDCLIIKSDGEYLINNVLWV